MKTLFIYKGVQVTRGQSGELYAGTGSAFLITRNLDNIFKFIDDKTK